MKFTFSLEDQNGPAEPDVRGEAVSPGGDLVLNQHGVHSASAVSSAKWAQDKHPAQPRHPAKAQASDAPSPWGASGRWWPPTPGFGRCKTRPSGEVDGLQVKLGVRSPARQGPTSQSAFSKINSPISIRYANVC